MKTVLRFADQLLSARVRAKKAQIAAYDPGDVEIVKNAQGQLTKMNAAGVAKILLEFEVEDAFENEP